MSFAPIYMSFQMHYVYLVIFLVSASANFYLAANHLQTSQLAESCLHPRPELGAKKQLASSTLTSVAMMSL